MYVVVYLERAKSWELLEIESVLFNSTRFWFFVPCMTEFSSSWLLHERFATGKGEVQ